MTKTFPFSVSLLMLMSGVTIAAPAVLTDWPNIKSAIAKDPAMGDRIAEIVVGMSLQQKIGQMTQPEIKFASPADIKKYYIGSILNGGGSWPQGKCHRGGLGGIGGSVLRCINGHRYAYSTPFSVITDTSFIAAFGNIQIVAGAANDKDALKCSELN